MNRIKSESNINTEITTPKIENINIKKTEYKSITEEPRYVINENDIPENENDIPENENDIPENENDIPENENDEEDECENDEEDENVSLYEILKFYLNRIFG